MRLYLGCAHALNVLTRALHVFTPKSHNNPMRKVQSSHFTERKLSLEAESVPEGTPRARWVPLCMGTHVPRVTAALCGRGFALAHARWTDRQVQGREGWTGVAQPC